jgi:hypothetical protein
MKKQTKILIWVFGNLFLCGKYFLDKYSIQCEPCPPDIFCPPCQTEFMRNFIIYLIIWNVIAVLFWIISNRKKTGANN